MPGFDFYTPAELRMLGLKSFGRRVVIKKTARLINPGRITIGDSVIVNEFALIHAGEEVVLHGNNHIGAHSEVHGHFGVIMERYATISSRVAIYTESDDYSGRSLVNPTIPDRFKPGLSAGQVSLGRFASVGTNSTILPGAVLEEGAAVGAHSLVKGRLEEWSIYGGVPARLISQRSREMIDLAAQFESGE